MVPEKALLFNKSASERISNSGMEQKLQCQNNDAANCRMTSNSYVLKFVANGGSESSAAIEPFNEFQDKSRTPEDMSNI